MKSLGLLTVALMATYSLPADLVKRYVNEVLDIPRERIQYEAKVTVSNPEINSSGTSQGNGNSVTSEWRVFLSSRGKNFFSEFVGKEHFAFAYDGSRYTFLTDIDGECSHSDVRVPADVPGLSKRAAALEFAPISLRDAAEVGRLPLRFSEGVRKMAGDSNTKSRFTKAKPDVLELEMENTSPGAPFLRVRLTTRTHDGVRRLTSWRIWFSLDQFVEGNWTFIGAKLAPVSGTYSNYSINGKRPFLIGRETYQFLELSRPIGKDQVPIPPGCSSQVGDDINALPEVDPVPLGMIEKPSAVTPHRWPILFWIVAGLVSGGYLVHLILGIAAGDENSSQT